MRTLRSLPPAFFVVALLTSTVAAHGQGWTGGYFSLYGGESRIDSGDDFVVFDKNLDGNFNDTITTAAGANAFSPGFCEGAAVSALPSGGCRQDDGGADYGLRGGYDWQVGSVVLGLVGEIGAPDLTDSVSAFSTTPAFYTFTREVDTLAALRARLGFGSSSFLFYLTGGGALAKVDHSFRTSNAVNTFVEDDDDMVPGFQYGGGFEFRFGGGGNWSASAEYLVTELDDEDRYTVRAQGPAPPTNPFILTNASGSDLRRADTFEFASARLVIGYRF